MAWSGEMSGRVISEVASLGEGEPSLGEGEPSLGTGDMGKTQEAKTAEKQTTQSLGEMNIPQSYTQKRDQSLLFGKHHDIGP